jgi:hypothetical protein
MQGWKLVERADGLRMEEESAEIWRSGVYLGTSVIWEAGARDCSHILLPFAI